MLSESAPIDREININPNNIFNFKYSSEGIIEFVSHILCEVSGYEEYELINQPLISLTHPGMPKILFEILTERLTNKKPMRLFVKLLAKDGRYYWLMMDFYTKSDQDDNILGHYSTGVIAPQYAVHKLQHLYKILSKIEDKTRNTKVSRRYLVGFLEERDLNYNQLIKELSTSKTFSKEVTPENNKLDTFYVKEKSINHNNSMNYSFFYENSQKRAPVVKRKSLFKRIFG